MSDGLSRSMATIASSISLPMVGCLALALQVRPAGLLRHPEDVLGPVLVRVLGVGALRLLGQRARRAVSSKASEMYLRKIRPRTTCLYSAASMLLRSLSAASQSLASKPRLAAVSLFLLPRHGIPPGCRLLREDCTAAGEHSWNLIRAGKRAFPLGPEYV